MPPGHRAADGARAGSGPGITGRAGPGAAERRRPAGRSPSPRVVRPVDSPAGPGSGQDGHMSQDADRRPETETHADTRPYAPDAEVVELCRDLIRIDTSNYGDDRGPGERDAAEYVAGKLAEAGLE